MAMIEPSSRSSARWGIFLSFALALMASCAPAAAPTGARSGDAAAAQAPARPSRVVIGNGGDVGRLSSKLDVKTSTFASEIRFLANSPLVVIDPQGTAHPRLAAELPSRDNGTWIVNPDGTMATTWKIRQNAVWHDGRPVNAKDFVLAYTVYTDERVEMIDRNPERLMSGVEAVDDKTFVIRWKQSYPWANELRDGQLEPLPEHLVGRLYEAGDVGAFENAPLWTSTDYVGTGPYRLVSWDRGTELTFRAFDNYYLGRPKIDEVVIKVSMDMNAMAANLLAGAMDATVSLTLTQQAGAEIRGQWDRTGEGRLVYDAAWFRNIQVQLEPSRVRPAALLDVRVRRALEHTIDRVSIAEVLSGGNAPAIETVMGPSHPLKARTYDAIAKYPFDRARAAALLQEVGWNKRGEALVGANGEQLALELRIPALSDNETEARIISNDWSQLGIDVSQLVYNQRSVDREYGATFPGLNQTAFRLDLPTELFRLTSTECAVPDDGYFGRNRGCWANADYDRAVRTAITSLDREERSAATIQALKVLSEELPVLHTSYSVDNIAVRKGLIGPGTIWPAQRGHTWNIHEWRWES